MHCQQTTESTQNGTEREITLKLNRRLSFLKWKKKQCSVSILATFYLNRVNKHCLLLLSSLFTVFHPLCANGDKHKFSVYLSFSNRSPLNFEQCALWSMCASCYRIGNFPQHVLCVLASVICFVISVILYIGFSIVQTTQFSSSFSPVFQRLYANHINSFKLTL